MIFIKVVEVGNFFWVVWELDISIFVVSKLFSCFENFIEVILFWCDLYYLELIGFG